MANEKILEKLKALDACYQARAWVQVEGFSTAQEAWDSPNIRPKDMLWILRRTMGRSYRKRRALALLAVELLDLTSGPCWYSGNNSDEALREAFIAYGKNEISFRALSKVAENAEAWTIGNRLYAALRGSGGMALEYQGLLPLRFEPLMTEQQALIRKHFPKPPRLA